MAPPCCLFCQTRGQIIVLDVVVVVVVMSPIYTERPLLSCQNNSYSFAWQAHAQ